MELSETSMSQTKKYQNTIEFKEGVKDQLQKKVSRSLVIGVKYLCLFESISQINVLSHPQMHLNKI